MRKNNIHNISEVFTVSHARKWKSFIITLTYLLTSETLNIDWLTVSVFKLHSVSSF